jgi:hypothetical protein
LDTGECAIKPLSAEIAEGPRRTRRKAFKRKGRKDDKGSWRAIGKQIPPPPLCSASE